MELAYRIDSVAQLKSVLENNNDFQCVVLGHESCPIFYQQQDVDGLIKLAQANGKSAKINIPTVFEDYLEFFKNETRRLIETYPNMTIQSTHNP
jgi:hypothetical protein